MADTLAAWWVSIDQPMLRSPDALFLKFCATWQEKKGSPY